jgi:two-component system, chemotaxis family, chemotaxis protein CheY
VERPALILVVDDSPTIRAFVRLAARGLPVEIAEAEDGMQALASLAQALPSLLLVDVQMPVLDGFGLLQALRADASAEVRALPVLLLTAERGEEVKERARRAGAQGLLEKPLRPPVVRAALEAHLAQRAQESGAPGGSGTGGAA